MSCDRLVYVRMRFRSTLTPHASHYISNVREAEWTRSATRHARDTLKYLLKLFTEPSEKRSECRLQSEGRAEDKAKHSHLLEDWDAEAEVEVEVSSEDLSGEEKTSLHLEI